MFDLARHFDDGQVHVQQWSALSDAEIIAELTAVRGIGVWAAEMFLIFNQLRPDVFPLDDIGLQKAVAMHYFATASAGVPGVRWRLGTSGAASTRFPSNTEARKRGLRRRPAGLSG